jgi:putative secretion ATPase (PEP-CTERM system associated)
MFESYFGLTASPFQLNPDPSFLFASKGHRRAHAYLRHGVFEGEGFIVVTGEIGAGKTTLVRALLEELDTEKVVAAQLVSTRLDTEDVLRSVAIAFGLSVRSNSKSDLLAELEAFLASLVSLGKRALLIVDEAQNLTPGALEQLRILSNLQLEQRSLLQTFLIGQPELRELIRGSSMESLRQRISASYHLGPLEANETRAYIEHRLAHVGWKADPTIADAAFAMIHQETGGIPRRINALCKRLLLGAFLAEEHQIGSEQVTGGVAELRAELGTDALPATAATGATGGAAANRATNGAANGSMHGAKHGALNGAVSGAAHGATNGALHADPQGAAHRAAHSAANGAAREAGHPTARGAAHGAANGAMRWGAGATHGTGRPMPNGSANGALNGMGTRPAFGGVSGATGAFAHGPAWTSASANSSAGAGAERPEAMRPFMMSAITARLDRLETNTANMLDMVRALVENEDLRPAPKKKPPPKPPGFGGPLRGPPTRR